MHDRHEYENRDNGGAYFLKLFQQFHFASSLLMQYRISTRSRIKGQANTSPLDEQRRNPYYAKSMNLGGIAQLVERLNGIQEARGSTPLTSIILKKATRLSRVIFWVGGFSFSPCMLRLTAVLASFWNLSPATGCSPFPSCSFSVVWADTATVCCSYISRRSFLNH